MRILDPNMQLYPEALLKLRPVIVKMVVLSEGPVDGSKLSTFGTDTRNVALECIPIDICRLKSPTGIGGVTHLSDVDVSTNAGTSKPSKLHRKL